MAFEIQRANYSWEKFQAKLADYATQEVAVVYLFIGPDFFHKLDDRRFRLKDIEQRLFLGHAEARVHAQRAPRATLIEYFRIQRESLGRATGRYLRRSAEQTGKLLVRERVFYPAFRGRGDWSPTFSHELGAALHPSPTTCVSCTQPFPAAGCDLLEGRMVRAGRRS